MSHAVRVLALVAIAAILFCGTGSTRADTLIGTTGGRSPIPDGPWVFADVFTVGSQNLTVSALGAYDAGITSGAITGGVPVGLYDYSTGSLLRSALIDSAASSQGDFGFASVAPVILQSGHQYEIVAANETDLYSLNSTVTLSPLITSNGHYYSSGTTLAFQGAGTPFSGTDLLGAASLQASPDLAAAPLPSSAWAGTFLLGGIAALRLRRRNPV